MDLLPLKFFDDLPRNPKIQAATDRIKEKIQLGQERFEDGQEIPETQNSPWADENELKMKIESTYAEGQKAEDKELKIFRIRLMETETIDLFEMPCVGYFEGTKEAEEAAYYNEIREKYEARINSVRVLTSNGSCQTEVPLLLRKCLQTKKIQNKDIGCTVTEWDMMDSFKKLDRKHRKKDKSVKGAELSCTERFLMSAQVMQRLFSSNNYNFQQLVYSSPPREIGKSFKYTLRILWQMQEGATGSVNHIATNSLNRKLIAVGYGDRGKDGTVCIWNAKNPHTPEKKIVVQNAVTCTKFSKETPYYLAAVTEAGDVLIVDVRKCSPHVRVVSSSVTNVIKDPLWSVTWFSHKDLQQKNEKVVTVGHSGVVMLWNPHDTFKTELGRLTFSKVPHDDMFMHRHHNHPSFTEKTFMRSTFHVVDIELDPTDDKTYYGSTTQGSLVVDPIICAMWSPSHCSVILTVSRKTLCIWDIRRSDLDPMTIVLTEEGTYFTTAIFNDSGTVVFVGSSDGTVTAYNLHEMPHPPYLQKFHLLSAFKKILWRNKALYEEVDFILNR